MKRQIHYIQKQALIVDFSTEERARKWHNIASTLYYSKILPMLNTVLDKHIPNDRYYFIDTLEIDLGNIDEKELQKAFLKKIELELIRILNSEFNQKISEKTSENNQLGGKVLTKESNEHLIICFYYFLDNGVLPWNSSLKSLAMLEAELTQEIGLEKLTSSPEFQMRLQQENIRRRLYFQFSRSFWEGVCDFMYESVLIHLHSIQGNLFSILTLLSKSDSEQKKIVQDLSTDIIAWIGYAAPSETQHWLLHYIRWMVRKAMPHLRPVGEKTILKSIVQELKLKNKEQHYSINVLVASIEALLSSAETKPEVKNVQQQSQKEDRADQHNVVLAEGASSDLPALDQLKHRSESKPKEAGEEKNDKHALQQLGDETVQDKATPKIPQNQLIQPSEKKGTEPIASDDLQDHNAINNETADIAVTSGEALGSSAEDSEKNKIVRHEDHSDSHRQHKTVTAESANLALPATDHTTHLSESKAEDSSKKDTNKNTGLDKNLAHDEATAQESDSHVRHQIDKKESDPIQHVNGEDTTESKKKRGDAVDVETVEKTDERFQNHVTTTGKKSNRLSKGILKDTEQPNDLLKAQDNLTSKNEKIDSAASAEVSQQTHEKQPDHWPTTREIPLDVDKKKEPVIPDNSIDRVPSGTEKSDNVAHSEVEEQKKVEWRGHGLPNAASEMHDIHPAQLEAKHQELKGEFSDNDFSMGTPASEEETNRPLYRFPELDAYYLMHAGVVLTWPYLTRLFNHVGYLENNTFKDTYYQQRAVHLMAYIASGQEQCEEHILVVHKFLCAWPLALPIIKDLVLTEEEKIEADQMLGSLIKNWTILKNTSLEGLRASFFERDGKLLKEDTSWRLIVEQKSYDMLLEHLPYALSVLKLPWMKNILKVDWV